MHADQIGEPEVERVEAVLDALLAFGGGFRRLRRPFSGEMAFPSGAASFGADRFASQKPPTPADHLWQRAGIVDAEQDQPQPMLAGELTAGATALDRHAIQVDTHLIERAALTLPQSACRGAPKVLPVFGGGELLASRRELLSGASASACWGDGGDAGLASSRSHPRRNCMPLSLPVCPKRQRMYSDTPHG